MTATDSIGIITREPHLIPCREAVPVLSREYPISRVIAMSDQAASGCVTHPALERHYSVQEIAKMWALSFNTIKRLFQDEPGVLAFGSPETRYGRQRITLRVPESVMLRVYRERTHRKAHTVSIQERKVAL
jgi:hypothetical protein